MEPRFNLLEVTRNETPQIVFPILIGGRSARRASFLWSVFGHLEEVVGIIFDDDDVY